MEKFSVVIVTGRARGHRPYGIFVLWYIIPIATIAVQFACKDTIMHRQVRILSQFAFTKGDRILDIADRIVHMEDGRLVNDRTTVTSIASQVI
jgi:hypothetical protein